MSRSSYQPGSERRRATSIGLAIAAHVLVLIVMVRLAPVPDPLTVEPPPETFQLLPEAKKTAKAAPRKEITKVKRAAGAAAPKAPAPPRPPASAKPPPPPSPLLIGGREMFEAADISKLGSGKGATGSSAGSNSGATYGPGEGPNGARLYRAEWYREPTRAELAFYLPSGGAGPGWADIACKTIDDYQVENCRALGESPLGSGLARALRQAAWQFRVRPPSIDGKPIIGAWVRIHFDFTTGKPG